MAIPTADLVSIVLATVVGVGALVAPLYIMVLRMYGGGEAATEERGDLDDTQQQIQVELAEISSELEELRTEVRMNGQLSETNQKHIHQLLLGKIKGDDTDIGNPHHRAEHCPLPSECPWHDAGPTVNGTAE